MHEPIFEISSQDPTAKQLRARLHASARELPAPWRWPLARVGNRAPIVLAEHVTECRRGVDIGYPAGPYDADLFVPVFAAQAGEVAYASPCGDEFAITLDHGELTTHYAKLSQMFVTRSLGRARRRQYVRAGDVIGYAAKVPLHCRFELWQQTDDGRGFVAIDPMPYLDTWSVPPPGMSERLRAMTDSHNEAA